MAKRISRRMFLALLLGGCVAQGDRYLPDNIDVAKGQGTIYVYRPLTALGKRGEDPFVSIAGKSYGRMRSGSFIAANFPEGDYDVTVKQSVLLLLPTIPKTVTVTVVRGSQSYVRVDQTIDSVSMSGGATVTQSTSIEEVPFDVGQAELAKTRQNN